MTEVNAGSKDAPMIDFMKVKDLIPVNGRLTIMCFRKGDNVVVVSFRAPNGKEKDKQLIPLRLEATPEELNSKWESAVKDLGEKQDEYIATLPSTSIKGRVDERKKELDKAIKKNGTKTAPAATGSPKKDAKPAPAPAPAIPDLFTGAGQGKEEKPQVKEAEATPDQKDESQEDRPGEEEAPESEEEFGSEQADEPAGAADSTQEVA